MCECVYTYTQYIHNCFHRWCNRMKKLPGRRYYVVAFTFFRSCKRCG